MNAIVSHTPFFKELTVAFTRREFKDRKDWGSISTGNPP